MYLSREGTELPSLTPTTNVAAIVCVFQAGGYNGPADLPRSLATEINILKSALCILETQNSFCSPAPNRTKISYGRQQSQQVITVSRRTDSSRHLGRETGDGTTWM